MTSLVYINIVDSFLKKTRFHPSVSIGQSTFMFEIITSPNQPCESNDGCKRVSLCPFEYQLDGYSSIKHQFIGTNFQRNTYPVEYENSPECKSLTSLREFHGYIQLGFAALGRI